MPAEQKGKERGNSQMLETKHNLAFILSVVGHLHQRVCNTREYPTGLGGGGDLKIIILQN